VKTCKGGVRRELLQSKTSTQCVLEWRESKKRLEMEGSGFQMDQTGLLCSVVAEGKKIYLFFSVRIGRREFKDVSERPFPAPGMDTQRMSWRCPRGSARWPGGI